MALSNPGRLDQMIFEVVSRPDVEHSIQLLKRPSFGLRQAEPREHETEEVPRSIPAESALWCKSFLERWPGQCEKEIEAPACGGCKCHAGVADCEWLYFVSWRQLQIKIKTHKRLCRVCKRHWAHAWTIAYHE